LDEPRTIGSLGGWLKGAKTRGGGKKEAAIHVQNWFLKISGRTTGGGPKK